MSTQWWPDEGDTQDGPGLVVLLRAVTAFLERRLWAWAFAPHRPEPGPQWATPWCWTCRRVWPCCRAAELMDRAFPSGTEARRG